MRFAQFGIRNAEFGIAVAGQPRNNLKLSAAAQTIRSRKRVDCIRCRSSLSKPIIRQRTDLQSLTAKGSPCLYTFDASRFAQFGIRNAEFGIAVAGQPRNNLKLSAAAQTIRSRKRVDCIRCRSSLSKPIIRQRTDLQSLTAKGSPCLYTFDASPQAASRNVRSTFHIGEANISRRSHFTFAQQIFHVAQQHI